MASVRQSSRSSSRAENKCYLVCDVNYSKKGQAAGVVAFCVSGNPYDMIERDEYKPFSFQRVTGRSESHLKLIWRIFDPCGRSKSHVFLPARNGGVLKSKKVRMLSLHLEMVLAPFRCWGAQPVRTNAGRAGPDSKLACFPLSMWPKLIALVLVTSRIVRA